MQLRITKFCETESIPTDYKVIKKVSLEIIVDIVKH